MDTVLVDRSLSDELRVHNAELDVPPRERPVLVMEHGRALVDDAGYLLTTVANATLGTALFLEPEERFPPYLYHLSAGLGAITLVAAAADAFLGARQARFEAEDVWTVQLSPLRDGAALALRGRFR